jgi:hypothetical protein
MEVIGDRKYVEIPGDKMHELPPLLVRNSPEIKRSEKVVGMATDVIEAEDLIPGVPADEWAPEGDVERRKMDLAINLVEKYLGLVEDWKWGDSVLEWIRQCEITFDSRVDLRNLLHADLWPHAGRSSFVDLLSDKAVATKGVELEKVVGLRLTFRQPPPLACFSDQFLIYLNPSVANSAYRKWAQMSPQPVASLPPERFRFDVVDMSL